MATVRTTKRQKPRKTAKTSAPAKKAAKLKALSSKFPGLSNDRAVKAMPIPKGPFTSALRQRLGYCLYKGAMKLRALLDETFAEVGLITPQFGIISLLIANGPLSQIDIGQSMSVDKATMVKLIDSLENLNLVRRTPHAVDRRIRMVGLTDHGKKMFDVLIAKAQAAELQFTANLTAAERETLRALSSRLLD